MTEYVVVVAGVTVTEPASSELVPVEKLVPAHPVELLILLGILVATLAAFVEDHVRLTARPDVTDAVEATRVELTVIGATSPPLTHDT